MHKIVVGKSSHYAFAKQVGAAALAGLMTAGFLSGCTTQETIDMRAEREIAAKKDLKILDPRSEIVLDEPLSLKMVIDIGLRNNLDLRVSEFEKEVSKDDALAKKLELLPDLDASVAHTARDNYASQDQYNFLTGNDTIGSTTVSDLKDNQTASLELTWNVLDFGVSYIRSRQAGLQTEVLETRRIRLSQQLALELTEAYWKAALAEDALDYVRQVENELKRQKSSIQRSVDDGVLDAIAAKEVEKRLLDIALSLRDLQADIAGARLDLARLMGLKQSTKFTLAREPIKPLLADMPPPERINAQYLEEYALLNRPELFEHDLTIRIQRDEVRAAMLSMLPGLSFSLSGNYDTNRLLHNQTWALFGANVGWNLLRLPSLYAQKKSAERGHELIRAERLQVTVAVLTQVHISMLDYAIAADRFRLYEESYRLTNDLMNMTLERNKAGLLSNLTVTQRLLEDMAAKLRRDQAVVDLIIAHRRLYNSLGVNPRKWDQNMAELGLDQPSFDKYAAAGSQEMATEKVEMATKSVEVEKQVEEKTMEREQVSYESAPAPLENSVPSSEPNQLRYEEPKPMQAEAPAELQRPRANKIEERQNMADPPEEGVTIGPWRHQSKRDNSETRIGGTALTSRQEVKYNAGIAKELANTQSRIIDNSAPGSWAVQVGAYRKLSDLRQVLHKAKAIAPELLSQSQPSVEKVRTVETALLRGRFPHLSQQQAGRVCRILKRNGLECLVVPPAG